MPADVTAAPAGPSGASVDKPTADWRETVPLVWHTDQVPALSALPTHPADRLDQSDRAQRLSRQFTASFVSQGVEPDTDDAQRSTVRVSSEPMVFAPDQWERLSDAVAARAFAMATLADRLRSASASPSADLQPDLLDVVLGAQGAVAIVDRSSGAQSAPALVVAAFDVAITSDGPFIVADCLDAPTGLGEALLVRAITSRAFGTEMAALGVTPYVEHLTRIREAVTELAPPGRPSPRTVLLARPSGRPGYSETAILATRLGLTLASPADLVVLQSRVWLRTLGGVEPVDVVFRSVDESETDPLTHPGGGSTAGVTALLQVWRTGEVGMANPVGLRGLEGGVKGNGSPEASSVIDRSLRPLINPDLWLSRFIGTPSDAEVPVIRVHVVLGQGGVSVLPGGLATSTNASGQTVLQDVWVRAGLTQRSHAAGRAEVPVDLAESVPTSAAEALFWAGRNAEQAETAARLLRVLVRMASDAEPVVLSAVCDVAATITRPAHGGADPERGGADLAPGQQPGGPLAVNAAMQQLWVSAGSNGSVSRSLSLLSMNLLNARSFLPGSTFEVIERVRMASDPLDTQEPGTVNAFALGMRADDVLAGLAALSGLIEESTVRSRARTFLLIGRRLQRLARTVDLLGPVVEQRDAVDDAYLPSVCEAILGSSESLIAYRRRYRTDVVVDCVTALLVHDESNPRSLAFQAASLVGLLTDLPQHPGHRGHVAGAAAIAALVSDASQWSDVAKARASLVQVRTLTASLASMLAEDWFAVDLVRSAGVA